MSDDGSDIAKWAFPDTSITTKRYLIIWADKDAGQSGLHANFKLSGSGEAVILVDPDQNVVDEVTFGQQTADISSGRYPNGTGDFVDMSPTFAAANANGMVGIADDGGEIPKQFSLSQNYPNPFNPSTTIAFSISKESHVTLKVFNVLGKIIQTIVSKKLPAGEHQYLWQADHLPSGLYFYKLESGSYAEMKKMMFLK